MVGHKGAYNDALTSKRNTVSVRLHNIFGAFAPRAERDLRALAKRHGADRTDYPPRRERTFDRHQPFVVHWGQRISAAIVMGDACRSLKAIDKRRSQLAAARAPARAVAPRPRHA